MSEYRIETDVLGEVLVSKQRAWKSQTQRSLQNFPIGTQKMPRALINNLALLKMCCAIANEHFSVISRQQKEAIVEVCIQIMDGKLYQEFPLSIWQTGSGTQTNMNMNEVITTLGNQLAGQNILHPNDTVNASQSSNDVFPSALHMMSADLVRNQLFPVLDRLIIQLTDLEKENQGIVKIGRTHFQDATPLYFSQEISGWRSMMEHSRKQIEQTLPFIYELALGGSAVGTGINVPKGFPDMVTSLLKNQTGIPYRPDENFFHALSSRDACAFLSGALKSLAANALKMANDIRYLASGPRCGLGEIQIPENEPGSSIMPGKINPTQVEALSMVCLQVIGNDTSISMAASQGNFELNVYLPLIAYNLNQSLVLLSEALDSFTLRCLKGLKANQKAMLEKVNNSLMLVTALSPKIGYEKAAKIARKAYLEDLSLFEAANRLYGIEKKDFDEWTSISNLIPE